MYFFMDDYISHEIQNDMSIIKLYKKHDKRKIQVYKFKCYGDNRLMDFFEIPYA